jgi:hypothetical protein
LNSHCVDGQLVGSATVSEDPAETQAEPEEPQPNADVEKKRPTGGKRALNILRATAVVLLMTIGALLVIVSVPAIWGRNLLLNTDRYVQTMSPLASDPGVQAGIIKAIDKQFDDNVDLEALAKQVLPPKASPLAGPLQSAAEGLVNTVATKFVQSDAFVTLWEGINRTAHKQIDAVLTGRNGGANDAVAIKKNIVTLNLAPVIIAVKKQLVGAGLTVASKVPVVGTTIEIAHLKGVDQVRSYVRLLNRAAVWLPLLGIGCLLVAILLSRKRRRSTIIAAISVTVGMVVIAAGLAIGRKLYLDSLPGIYLTNSAAESIYNTLVRYLRDGLRLVIGVALLICLIAWLTGPRKLAVSIRHGLAKGPKALGQRWSGSKLGSAVAENRGTFAGIIFGLAALVLVLWSNPTILVVIVIAIITIALLAVAYFTKRPSSPEAVAPAA